MFFKDLNSPIFMWNKILGNAVKANIDEVSKELGHILIQGEEIQLAFKLVRDFFVFTNFRLILVDKQGLTGKKVEYHTILYKSITHFSLETGGRFDLDADLKIWISGTSTPIEKKFKKGGNLVAEVQGAVAYYTIYPSK